MEARRSKKEKKVKPTKEKKEISQERGEKVETAKKEAKIEDEFLPVNKQEIRKKNQKLLKKYTKRTASKIVLNKKQVKKAAKALKKYSKTLATKNAMNLLEQEDKFINVNVLMTQVPNKYSPKPLSIPIPHPIYGPKYETRACMFVKDPERDFKDKIQDLNVPCLAKVIGFKKLYKEFDRYKYKLDLINEHELFFTDVAIYKMLPKPCGKMFYENKKFPFPVELSGLQETELESTINDLFKATYFHVRNGPNYTLKIARTSMSTTEIYENVASAVTNMLPYIMMHDGIKHSRVQCISLKIGESIDLPIFTQLMNSEVASYIVLKDEVEKELAKANTEEDEKSNQNDEEEQSNQIEESD